MIKVDFVQFIHDHLWCGWWYDHDPLRGSPRWNFERHPAVRLITIMKLKEARRIACEYNDRKMWGERNGDLDFD